MLAKVTPKEGRTVKHPASRRALLEKGERVELSTYWRRRERDGDVTIEIPKEATPTRAAARARNEEE